MGLNPTVQLEHQFSAFTGQWTELVPVLLGFKTGVCGEFEDEALVALENLLHEYAYSEEYVPEEKQAIGEQIEGIFREFLEMLASWNAAEQPVWLGLLAVEDRFTFFRMSIPLIGFMWT